MSMLKFAGNLKYRAAESIIGGLSGGLVGAGIGHEPDKKNIEIGAALGASGALFAGMYRRAPLLKRWKELEKATKTQTAKFIGKGDAKSKIMVLARDRGLDALKKEQSRTRHRLF